MKKHFLNIGDTAGVASILYRYLKTLYSIESEVVTYSHLDPWGITKYNGGKLVRRSHITNAGLAMKALLFPVVHLHVHVDMARRLRKLYPSKKIIVHWHGEELRQRGWEGVREITSVSDAVFVSTEDLLAGAPEGVVHLPNPVDMELFRPIPSLRKPNSALYIVKGYRGEDLEWPKKVTSKLGLELDVRDRKVKPISYNEMPMLLNRYRYYVDRNYPESLSKTALEPLACGVKVIGWKEEILTSLPSEHDPKNVVQQFISTLKKRLFNEILGSLT